MGTGEFIEFCKDEVAYRCDSTLAPYKGPLLHALKSNGL